MVVDVLLGIERDGWSALCDGTAADFYERVMTDDGRMVLADGSVMDRAQVVAALRHAPRWARFEMDDPQLVTLSDDAAALVYRSRSWRSADEPPFTAAMSSVYRRDADGAWRLALYQQTPIP